MAKQIKLKGKGLLSRLTGISTPFGGLNWEAPPDERVIARKLFVFLADRRVLYHPYEMEIGPHVIQSVLEIRGRITSDLENISDNSPLRQSLKAMQAACRHFLDENQKPNLSYGWHHEARIHSTLGELRALFGIHIAQIAYGYNLEVEDPLSSILPPKVGK
jgi:hypothetical protein